MTPTQQINLIGVVEDGGNPRAGVPLNPRQTVRLLLGQDISIRLTAVYRSGGLVDLTASGVTTLLSIRKKPSDAVPVINPPIAGVVDPLQRNACAYAILHGAFRLPYFNQPGLYIYDVWLTTQNGPIFTRVNLVPLSPLILEPSATTVISP